MADRDYVVTSTDEGELLRIAAAGAFSLERTKRLFDLVAIEVRQNGSQRVLLDLRGVVGQLTRFERFEIGAYAVGRFHVKTAVIGRAEMVDHYGETVAVNRGVNALVFIDEAAALAWLLLG